MADGPLIRVEELRKSYVVGDVTVHALRGVTLEIARGSFVAVIGASGSGKSTFMNIMGLLDQPSSGRYFLAGEDVSGFDRDRRAILRNRTIGFVFQSFNLLPRTSAIENVELPLVYNGKGWPTAERHRRASALLEAVGIGGRAHHTPSQLSGGQQQRVAVARAVAGEPVILLADEPTGNLDSKSGESVMELLHELYMTGATICMVTHDPRYARHADRSIYLFDGRVVDEPEPTHDLELTT